MNTGTDHRQAESMALASHQSGPILAKFSSTTVPREWMATTAMIAIARAGFIHAVDVGGGFSVGIRSKGAMCP
ncbi:hypothetical protein LJ362_07590 [Brevibacterium sp. JSBI002]|nr:hypothetical protein [Brevibacterium sp. JSBI002]UZD63675.1 hypothetical protein LJ362_07590 [Brevibacterium sp. JSBI002]